MDINRDVINKEIEKIKSKVKEYKSHAEANMVGCMYNNVELIYTTDLDIKDFINPVWQLYFAIAKEIVIKEKKESLDDLTIGLFLQKHSKMKTKYDQYKGFSTIEDLKGMVKEENFDGYLKESNKWKTALNLLANGIIISLQETIDATTDEMYDFYEAVINDSFVKGEEDDISGTYDIAENLMELIEELDKGLSVGLPYDEMPLLNRETNGSSFGNITLIGGLSGIGKSSFVRSKILPSIIKNNERALVILNEEDELKWRAELLIWVANNVLKRNINKYNIRDGKFSDEHMNILKESAKWIENHKEQIIIIPFKRWNTMSAIKLIKKYQRAFDFKYYFVDTFKPEANSDMNNSWMVLMMNMVALYDTIKKNKNSEGVSLTCTFQLSKDSATKRYYSQSSVGIARNMIDVCSVCIMARWLMQDEYAGQKHEVKVYELKGKNTKIPVILDDNKKYQIFFIPKTRFGTSDAYQILCEVDLSRNIYKEIGICSVKQDF